MNADGSNPTLVPNTVGGVMAAWSPDGTRIAYVSDQTGSSQIYAVNVDGTGSATQLTNSPAGKCNLSPRYAPEGDRIVFASDRGGGSACGGAACLAIYTMRADGSRVRKVTTDSLDAGVPDWSPDGNNIDVLGGLIHEYVAEAA